MKKLVRSLTAPMAVTAIAAALTVLSAGSAKAQYDFIGATSTDPTVNSNYSGGTAPTFPQVGTTPLNLDDTTYGFDYSATEGTSTFGVLQSGVNNASTAGDEVTGGNLSFGTNGGFGVSILGFIGASTFSVTGGTLNFLGTAGYNGDGNSLEMGFQGNSALNVSGGLVTTAGNLGLGWYKGSNVVNISGGTFNILGTGGTDLNALGGGATGALNFLAGNGVYEESASSTFASGIKVNFAIGTGDKFEVASLGDSTFSALALAGNLSYGSLTLDDTATDSNYYLNYLTETQSGGVETLSAPEPSTWALMLGGLGVLVLIQRRRSLNA